MNDEVKYRISTATGTVLVVLAAIADIFTFIPIVGDFLGWLFWVIMAVVFWKLGLGLINFRRFLPMIISTVAEFFPVVQEFPTIVAGMVAIIIMTRIEDKTGIKMLPSRGKTGVRMPKKQSIPVNATRGTREPRKKNIKYGENYAKNFNLETGERL